MSSGREQALNPPPEAPTLTPWTETIRGKERLKAMLELDPRFWRDYTPFLRECLGVVGATFVVSSMLYGTMGGKGTLMRFKKDHRMVLYDHQLQYHRQKHFHVTMGAAIGIWRKGVGATGAATLAMLCHGLPYIYENQLSFFNILAACVAPTIYYRLFKGFKPFLFSIPLGLIRGVPLAFLAALALEYSEEDQRRRHTRHEGRYQQYLLDVYNWREGGIMMDDAFVRRERFYRYVVAPRPWLSAEEQAKTLPYRQIPLLTDEEEEYLMERHRRYRNHNLKRYFNKMDGHAMFWNRKA